MENYSYSSYPDSRSSSPRSREVDTENHSRDECLSANTFNGTIAPNTSTNMATGAAAPAANNGNFKVKLVCSYGGKIQPRPRDNQLAYIGGDTKILAVDRHINFAALMAKLSCFSDAKICLKYHLPGEDLDALISVTNDEDLEHMMVEYDRFYRASAKPARLRLFLFPFNSCATTSFGPVETKSERQWFVEVLNSVQIHPQNGSPPAPVTAGYPDFLFGLDKGYSVIPATKLPESAPPPAVHEVTPKDLPAGLDRGSDDQQRVGEQLVPQSESQKQLQEFQKLQVASNEQNVQRRNEEANANGNGSAYSADYYSQGNPERIATPPPAPVQVQLPAAAYMSERHVATCRYPMAAAAGTDQQVYLIPTPAGMFQALGLRPVMAPATQPNYGMPRMVPTEMYKAMPPSLSHSQANVGVPKENTGTGQQKVGVTETGFLVGYDNAGRQVYYTAAPGGIMPSYQVMSAGIDGRQGGNIGGGALNSEGKVIVNKVSQASAV